MRFEFHPEALAENEDAARYYAECQNGLELRFIAAPAVEALQAIRDYITLDQPFYVARFIDRMTISAEQLIIHPGIGRQVPETRLEDIREIIFQRYRIIYRMCPHLIQILTVENGARNLAGSEPKPWEVG